LFSSRLQNQSRIRQNITSLIAATTHLTLYQPSYAGSLHGANYEGDCHRVPPIPPSAEVNPSPSSFLVGDLFRRLKVLPPTHTRDHFFPFFETSKSRLGSVKSPFSPRFLLPEISFFPSFLHNPWSIVKSKERPSIEPSAAPFSHLESPLPLFSSVEDIPGSPCRQVPL